MTGETDEQRKLRIEQAQGSHKEYLAAFVENMKGSFIHSAEALRSMQVLNAGALTAVVAFLGVTRDDPALRAKLAVPFSLFVTGLIFAGLATLLGFFAQVRFTNAMSAKIRTWHFPFYEAPPRSLALHASAMRFYRLAILCVVASFIILIAGLISFGSILITASTRLPAG